MSEDKEKMPFVKKLQEDKVFLLALIDDPGKAFIAYGYQGDDILINMLSTLSANIRERAIAIFSEIAPAAISDGCNGCRACQLCSSAMAAPGSGNIR